MVLPNFFVCGVPKAGTTSLYKYLDAHPDVFMSTEKEPWFFQGEAYEKGLEWYSETFFEGYGGEKAIGEATPVYFAYETAVRRIGQDISDPWFVFLLRNPAERAWSEYWWRIQNGKLSPLTSFGEFIRSGAGSFGIGLINIGKYYRHLKRWEEAFGRERMHVLLSRDLATDTQSTLRSLFRFLDVNATADLENLDTHKSTRHPKNTEVYTAVQKAWRPLRGMMNDKLLERTRMLRGQIKSLFFRSDNSGRPEMDPEDRAYLSEAYEDSNQRLADWLGRDLSHWT